MDLARLFATARQRWLIFVLGALVGLAGGFAYAQLATPVYRSSATVLFSLDKGSSVSELAEGTAFTQELVPSFAMVADMPIVLDPVISRLGLEMTAAQLSKKVAIGLDQGSLIMQIQVTDSQARRAADIAEAIASQLIETVPTLSVQAPGQAKIAVTTISGAVAPLAPASPNLPFDVAVGLLAGLLGAVLLVSVLELVLSSPVIHDRRTAVRVASAPVLGTITYDPEAHRRPLPVSTHPYLRRAEGYRLLLTSLQLMRTSREPLTLVVTAAAKGDGSTSTAVNLAVAICHTAQRVLLIDADLRSPGVAGLLGVEGAGGLATVLAEDVTWRSLVQTWVTQIWGDRKLSVLPAGPPPENASDLLSSQKMRELLAEVRLEYDVVIVDSPALLSVTDAATLAAQADGALLVIDSRHSRQWQISEAVGRLRMGGASVLGVVMNRTPEEQNALKALRLAVTLRRPRRILHSNHS